MVITLLCETRCFAVHQNSMLRNQALYVSAPKSPMSECWTSEAAVQATLCGWIGQVLSGHRGLEILVGITYLGTQP